MSNDDNDRPSIELLEARLKRIEYIIGGHQPQSVADYTSTSASASQRLQELQRALNHVTSQSNVAQALLKLYSQHTDLFDDYGYDSNKTEQPLASMQEVILATASSYQQVASSLISVTDMPLPKPQLSATLIHQTPSLSKLELLQISQRKEIDQLKQRTASLLHRWYQVDILRSGEYWASVEARLAKADQKLRQIAALQKDAAGPL